MHRSAGKTPWRLGLVTGREVERWLKRNGARNAIVTNSVASRGVMTALGWFGIPSKRCAIESGGRGCP